MLDKIQLRFTNSMFSCLMFIPIHVWPLCVCVWKFSPFHSLLGVTGVLAGTSRGLAREGAGQARDQLAPPDPGLRGWERRGARRPPAAALPGSLPASLPTYWAPERDATRVFLNLALHLFLPIWLLPDKMSVVLLRFGSQQRWLVGSPSPSHLDPSPSRKYIFLLLLKSPSPNSSLLSGLITWKLLTAVVQGRSSLRPSTPLLYSYGRGRKETHLLIEGDDSEVGRHRAVSFQIFSVFWSLFL